MIAIYRRGRALLVASLVCATLGVPSWVLAQGSASLSVSGMPTAAVTRPGDTFRQSFLIGRYGSLDGLNPYAEIRLPTSLLFTSLVFDNANVACTAPAVGSTGTVRCDLSSAPNGLIQAELDLRIDPTTPIGSVLETVINVGADGITGSPEYSRLALPALVQSGNEVADLSVRVAAEHAFVLPRQPTSFQVIVENAGPDAAAWPLVIFTEPKAQHRTLLRTVPALGAHVPPIPPGWTCQAMISPPVIPPIPTGYRCSAISLPVGTSVFSFTGDVMPVGVVGWEITAPITLDATIATVSTDPFAGNNAGGVSVGLGTPPATAIPSTSTAALWVLLSLLATAGIGGLLSQRNE